jgi:FixJ family two-component response regulator
MADPKPLVFVIDDDPSVRRALSRLLKSHGFTVETFASAGEFLMRPHYDGPGCLVLDLQMPGLNGLELQQQLAPSGYQLPIVFITGHGNVPASVKAMKAGAVDFLTKPFESKDLFAAIQQALQKDEIARKVCVEVDHIQQKLDRLTPRELEVMKLLLRGLMNKHVAAELGISVKTLKLHRARVMEKMQVHSVAELVHMDYHRMAARGPH